MGKGIKEDSMSRKIARGYAFTYRFLEWNHWRIEKVKLPWCSTGYLETLSWYKSTTGKDGKAKIGIVEDDWNEKV